MIFFDDVTDTNNPNSATLHRPRTALHRAGGRPRRTIRWRAITSLRPICATTCTTPVAQSPKARGDTWLSREVPKILNSAAYKNGGALFITWDEGEGGDGPIGMIVLSPNAKGGGYSNTIHYTHSSTLRTVQEIFGVTPLLGDAANATDLQRPVPGLSISKPPHIEGWGGTQRVPGPSKPPAGATA